MPQTEELASLKELEELFDERYFELQKSTPRDGTDLHWRSFFRAARTIGAMRSALSSQQPDGTMYALYDALLAVEDEQALIELVLVALDHPSIDIVREAQRHQWKGVVIADETNYCHHCGREIQLAGQALLRQRTRALELRRAADMQGQLPLSFD